MLLKPTLFPTVTRQKSGTSLYILLFEVRKLNLFLREAQAQQAITVFPSKS